MQSVAVRRPEPDLLLSIVLVVGALLIVLQWVRARKERWLNRHRRSWR
jgi:hypothetical protein